MIILHRFQNIIYNDTNRNFIGHDEIGKRAYDNDFVLQFALDNTALRYATNLLTVDWTNIVNEALPFTSIHRRRMILHCAGRFAINPVLLLSKVIQDQHDVAHTMISDEEFRMSLKSFANDLSRYDEDFEAKNIETKTSNLEYTLRKAFSNNEGLMNDYLSISNAISHRFGIPTTASESSSIYQHDISKRKLDEKIQLALPFSKTECWQLGKYLFNE